MKISKRTLLLVLLFVVVVLGFSLLFGEAVYGSPGRASPQVDWGGAGRVSVGEVIKVYAKFDLTMIALGPTIKLEVVYPDHSPQWEPWRFELPLSGGEIGWEDPYGITYQASVGPPDDRGVITVQAPEVVVERFLGNLTRNPAVWENSAAYLPHEAGLGVGFATDLTTGEVGFYAGRVRSEDGHYRLVGQVEKLVVIACGQLNQRQCLTFVITDEIRQSLGFQPWGGETGYVVTFDEVWSPPLLEPKAKPPPGITF